MNKKINVMLLVCLLISILTTSFIGAATTSSGGSVGTTFAESISKAIDSFIGILTPITSALFGAASATGDNAFITWMAFLLTLLVIGGVISPLNIFGDKQGINWAIAFILAWIGTRFIPIEALRSFTVPSEGLVGALFLIVPFIVVANLIFRGTTNPSIRRVLWVVYGVITTTLFFRAWANTEFISFYWIYIGIIVACIIAFLFDGTLQAFLRTSKNKRAIEASEETEQDRILAKITDLETARAAYVQAGNSAEVAKINLKINRLKKAIS
jgi:hypothetical protein